MQSNQAQMNAVPRNATTSEAYMVYEGAVYDRTLLLDQINRGNIYNMPPGLIDAALEYTVPTVHHVVHGLPPPNNMPENYRFDPVPTFHVQQRGPPPHYTTLYPTQGERNIVERHSSDDPPTYQSDTIIAVQNQIVLPRPPPQYNAQILETLQPMLRAQAEMQQIALPLGPTLRNSYSEYPMLSIAPLDLYSRSPL